MRKGHHAREHMSNENEPTLFATEVKIHALASIVKEIARKKYGVTPEHFDRVFENRIALTEVDAVETLEQAGHDAAAANLDSRPLTGGTPPEWIDLLG